MWGLESQTAPDSLLRAPNPEASGPAVAEGQGYDVAQPFLLFQATDNLNNLEPYKMETEFCPSAAPTPLSRNNHREQFHSSLHTSVCVHA